MRACLSIDSFAVVRHYSAYANAFCKMVSGMCLSFFELRCQKIHSRVKKKLLKDTVVAIKLHGDI